MSNVLEDFSTTSNDNPDPFGALIVLYHACQDACEKGIVPFGTGTVANKGASSEDAGSLTARNRVRYFVSIIGNARNGLPKIIPVSIAQTTRANSERFNSPSPSPSTMLQNSSGIIMRASKYFVLFIAYEMNSSLLINAPVSLLKLTESKLGGGGEGGGKGGGEGGEDFEADDAGGEEGGGADLGGEEIDFEEPAEEPEAPAAAELLGLKLATNEFVAYIQLGGLEPEYFTDRTKVIILYALCGFANFSSVGILISGIGAMAPERTGDLIAVSVKALIGATLASCLTGLVAGLFV